MSKYVKQLMTDELKHRWEGVQDALLVDVAKLEANDAVALRRRLREKGVSLMVVKNSLALRATEGTSLAAAFEGIEGTHAVAWGAEDIVSLAKEVVAATEDATYEAFETRGGVMDGARLSAEEVKQVSKWPSRTEQLSILMGQILGPGMTLNAQLLGPGASLGSQIKQKGEEEE